MTKNTLTRTTLFGATALCSILIGGAPALAQTLTVDPGSNTEPDSAPAPNDAGFVISLDGVPINADPTIEDRIRRTDIALAEADIQISFDGLSPERRLNVEVAGPTRAATAGDTVTLRSETNYPSYIQSAELRIFDAGAIGGARLLSTVPVAPNGTARVVVPDGRDVVVVHRVYDDGGRYDETAPVSLTDPDQRGLTAAEDGVDLTAVRRIPVRGGAITVAVTGATPGATLTTLGERVTADSDGNLVIQRILPPGNYAVDAALSEHGTTTALSRDLEVPRSDWFYVVLGDVTISGIGSDAGPEETGRLAYFIEGEFANGVRIVSSVDTGHRDLDTIFNRLDARDPESLTERLETYDGYLTFGDDSTITDLTPTSGRMYLRADYRNSFALFGDFQATLDGNTFVRNERVLYGAQGVFESDAVTPEGDARAAVELYAAQADQLVGRDIFRGTGGSVYFLRRPDVTPGTASLSVELRDGDTGRLIERRALIEGADYQVNYLQGVITLTRPLDGQIADGLIQTTPGGDVDVNLVAQYEYTPVGVDIDGLAYGGRAEVWISDDVRLGVSGTTDETGLETQTAIGVDLRYQFGTNSFLQLDYARTEGPGFSTTLSLDGGLSLDREDTASGDGDGIRLEAQADFGDLGLAMPGTVGGYYEDRSEGFSTLDYQVTALTGDETLYGGFVTAQHSPRLAYALEGDHYENGVGEVRNELSGEVEYLLSDLVALTFATEFLERNGDNRADIGARADYALTDEMTLYAFGYTSVITSGLDDNDRLGVGFSRDVGYGWSYGAEVSGGTGGIGAELYGSHATANGNSTYFGYELDPNRSAGTGFGVTEDGGRFVTGGRRQLSDDLVVYGENIYDVFGEDRSLTSAYGVEYQINEFWSVDTVLAFGNVNAGDGDDFTREGLSVGLRYSDEATAGSLRAEVRYDDAADDGSRDDAQFYALVGNLVHEFSEADRLLLSITASDVSGDEAAILNGTYVDTRVGYAYRPVTNERVNVLAGVRYLHDDVGQTIDGIAGAGDVQRSLVFSVEGNYDLDERWTLGGKIAGRLTESGPDIGSLVDNDAYLYVANARYHLVREWDVLLEGRQFEAVDSGFSETGLLGAVYRQFGDNLQVGVGYNFGSFSDDLTDLTTDDGGFFINFSAAF